MTISEKIKGLFQRRPLTEEELAARSEAASKREQALQEAAEINRREGGPINWSRSPPP
jgi:hypothetical protein